MKLLILGATGGIGLEIVRQAIDGGHQVTALVRTPERLKEFGERIAVIQGDVLNSGELARPLKGKTLSYQVSAPGNPDPKPTPLFCGASLSR